MNKIININQHQPNHLKALHTLNHVASLQKSKSRRYATLVFFSPVDLSWIITSGIPESPEVRFLIVWLKLNHFLVQQPDTTNTMHLQSTQLPNLKHLYSDPHLESGRRFAVELYSRNSELVKLVSCFYRGALSLIFEMWLNVTLPVELFTTGVAQRNLEFPLPPNSVDSHQTQN